VEVQQGSVAWGSLKVGSVCGLRCKHLSEGGASWFGRPAARAVAGPLVRGAKFGVDLTATGAGSSCTPSLVRRTVGQCGGPICARTAEARTERGGRLRLAGTRFQLQNACTAPSLRCWRAANARTAGQKPRELAKWPTQHEDSAANGLPIQTGLSLCGLLLSWPAGCCCSLSDAFAASGSAFPSAFASAFALALPLLGQRRDTSRAQSQSPPAKHGANLVLLTVSLCSPAHWRRRPAALNTHWPSSSLGQFSFYFSSHLSQITCPSSSIAPPLPPQARLTLPSSPIRVLLIMQISSSHQDRLSVH